jgi:hypothetical protein
MHALVCQGLGWLNPLVTAKSDARFNNVRLALGIIRSIAGPKRAHHLLPVADARVDANVVWFMVEPQPFRRHVDCNRHVLEPMPFARKGVEAKIVEAETRECTPGYVNHALDGRLPIEILKDLVRSRTKLPSGSDMRIAPIQRIEPAQRRHCNPLSSQVKRSLTGMGMRTRSVKRSNALTSSIINETPGETRGNLA